jgi:hypothetical protein
MTSEKVFTWFAGICFVLGFLAAGFCLTLQCYDRLRHKGAGKW